MNSFTTSGDTLNNSDDLQIVPINLKRQMNNNTISDKRHYEMNNPPTNALGQYCIDGLHKIWNLGGFYLVTALPQKSVRSLFVRHLPEICAFVRPYFV